MEIKYGVAHPSLIMTSGNSFFKLHCSTETSAWTTACLTDETAAWLGVFHDCVEDWCVLRSIKGKVS